MINRRGQNRKRRLAPRASLATAAVFVLILAGVAPAGATPSSPSNPMGVDDQLEQPVTLVSLERTDGGSLRTETVEVSRTSDLITATASAAADPDVLTIEPETRFTAFASDDPHRVNQWGLDRVAFEEATTLVDTSDVVVAVVDTGVRATHEDLQGVLLTGADMIDGVVDGTEADHFHGSHVAGIIAANTGNGIGMSASAPGVKILPVRVLDSSGSGSSSDVADGIIWAADNGADVINLSLGSTSNSLVVESAIDYAVGKGVVVVAAAGNSGAAGNPIMYPAALPNVISVGAIDSYDARASFSGYGDWVDLTAPGVSILSLHGLGDTSYAYANGTSMASPFVASAAALLKAADPTITPAEVLSVLTDTAEDLGPTGFDAEFGYGLVDPVSAVLAETGVDPGGEPDPGPTDPPPTSAGGYALVTSAGRVLTVGSAGSAGSMEGTTLAQPVVGATQTPSGNGYWMTAGDGGIFSFGDAQFLGSTGDINLAQPIVGMAATPTGNGYWLAASDGGIFTFGDAQFFGSTGDINLAQPIVGMAATPTGNGYWLAASDGGIFTFGDAQFFGSTGDINLAQPIVDMAATPTGNGYWLFAADGGVFVFGDAAYVGSAAGQLQAGETVESAVNATTG